MPFPAVTVDTGDVLNPWGFLEALAPHYAMTCHVNVTGCDATRGGQGHSTHLLARLKAQIWVLYCTKA